MVPIATDSEIINYILRQAALFGTSQLQYVVGVIFAHKLLMIILHGFVQTLFIIAFKGIAFIVLFNLT